MGRQDDYGDPFGWTLSHWWLVVLFVVGFVMGVCSVLYEPSRPLECPEGYYVLLETDNRIECLKE